ncbi:MAG: ester cyclase [SAR202 cluster bacterium]|nr:ester cyclase [SAR202 cluster bacterium]
MSEEANKAIVRRVFEELINRHKLDVAYEVFAPEYLFEDPLLKQPIRGPKGFRDLIAMYLDAVPDVKITVDAQFADGDMVSTRWTARGTHTGPMLGIAPTGKKYVLPGVLVSQCKNGKIVRDWEYRDDLGMLRQVGAIKLPGD